MNNFITSMAALTVVWAGGVSAETLNWTGSGTTRSFTQAENWQDPDSQPISPNPANGDILRIGEAARVTNGPIFNADLSNGLFEELVVSAPSLTINTVPIPPILTIEGGTLQALNVNLADAPSTLGRITQTGGRFLVRELRTSASNQISGGTSEYRLEDGYMSAVFAQIGDDGDSTFRQSGGQFDAGNFLLGGSTVSNSSGTLFTRGRAEYIMNGGVLNTGFLGFPDGTTDINLNRNGVVTEIGAGSPATFVLNGGTHHVRGGRSSFSSPLLVGAEVFNRNSGDVPDDPNKHLGEYIIRDGGRLLVDFDTVVGASANPVGATLPNLFDPGNGLIRQSGGEHVISRDLILGAYGSEGSGQGRYRMSDGTLDVGRNIIIGEQGADGVGTGSMSVTGGTVTALDIRIAPSARSAGEPLANPDNELIIGDGFNGDTSGTVFARDVVVGGGGTAGDAPSAILEVSGVGLLNANSVEVRDGGMVKGTGRIDTGRLALLRRGFLAPGLSPGILDITGDLFLGDGALLILEIAGRNEGDWDVLNIGGNLLAEAGAQIRVDFLDDFLPEDGDSFNFFNVTGETSEFDQLLADGLIDISLGNQSALTFDFSSQGVSFRETSSPTPVSLPASALFMLLGIASLGGASMTANIRRKKG